MPIPLLNAVQLLQEIARAEGADAPSRMVDRRTAFELGLIGVEALRGRTLGEGFMRLARTMPAHCTHEFITVTTSPDVLHISEGFTAVIGTDEARHLVQQYATAIIEMICGLCSQSGPYVAHVAMIPHPQVGLAHLRPWLGDRIRSAGRSMLDIEIPAAIAEQPIPAKLKSLLNQTETEDSPPLIREQNLSGSVESLIEGMLPSSGARVDRLARAAGLPRRTFQRRLDEEGTTYGDLVEKTRERIARARLSGPNRPRKKELASALGYSGQATLTRALKRWSGEAARRND